MKKILSSLIIISLAATLTGCNSSKSGYNTEKAKTVVELGSKYDYQVYKVLVDDVFITYMDLKEGTEINITNEDSRFYYIDLNGLSVAVEKEYVDTEEKQFKDSTSVGVINADTKAIFAVVNRGEEIDVLSINGDVASIVYNGTLCEIPSDMIRDENESVLPWDGYAKSGAKLYKDYNCTEVLDTLSINDKIHIIDQVNDVYVVELEDGTIAYMPVARVSEVTVTIASKQTTTVTYSSNSSDDSGNISESSQPSSPSDSSSNDGESGSLNGGGTGTGDGEEATLPSGDSSGGSSGEGSGESIVIK